MSVYLISLLHNTSPLFLPEIKIRKALPQKPERNRLSIVHITFARVVSDDAVHYDGLFPFVKPARLPAKPAGCLAWSARHENEREEPDK